MLASPASYLLSLQTGSSVHLCSSIYYLQLQQCLFISHCICHQNCSSLSQPIFADSCNNFQLFEAASSGSCDPRTAPSWRRQFSWRGYEHSCVYHIHTSIYKLGLAAYWSVKRLELRASSGQHTFEQITSGAKFHRFSFLN